MHIFHPLGLIPISVRSVLKKKSPRSGAAAACGCGPIRGRESGERCFRTEHTLTGICPPVQHSILESERKKFRTGDNLYFAATAMCMHIEGCLHYFHKLLTFQMCVSAFTRARNSRELPGK